MDKPIRILLVEDSLADAELAQHEIRRALPTSIFERVETRDDFLAALEAYQPDLIISDYNLPRFDGMTALKLTQEYMPLTPVVIWTGSLTEDTAVECMKAGASNYVIKENIKRLGAAIVHVLEEKQMHLERQRAEEALRESEVSYHGLFNSVRDAIYIQSQDGRFMDANQGAVEMYGYPHEWFIGKTPLDLSAPGRNDMEQILAQFQETFTTSSPHQFEFWGQRANGEIFPKDVRLFKGNHFGEQVIIALAQDITERKQVENEIRGRERYFALLNQITHTILAAQDSEATSQTLARNLASLFDADDCYITHWDEEKKQTIPVASTAQLEQTYSNFYLKPGEVTVTSSIMKSERVLVVEDTFNSPHVSPDVIKHFPIRSALGIPFIVGEHKFGAAIVAFKTLYHFSPEEIIRAEQAGSQIALAIWNMQQDIELQRNLREAKTLAEIAQALSETESIGLDNVLHLIVTSAKDLIANAEQSVIHLLNEKEQTLTSQAAAGFSNSEGGKKNIHFGQGIAGQVIMSGETLNIADVNTDPRFVKLDGAEPAYRSLMVASVHSGEKKLGTISIQSNIPNAFTPNDIKLLSQLGTQAAIAIENANLLENTKQALKEANALYRVNKGLVASLEPDDLLQDTIELLQTNFDYHYVQIFVADPDSGNFIMRAGSGKIGAQLKARGYQLAPGEGIVGYTAETGAAFFTNNVDDVVSFVRNPLLPDTKSELAVPVKIGNNIAGLLDIHQVPPKSLSQRDLQLVSAVADQLAVALQKADLYETLQISLQQEKAIRNQLMQNERLAVMGRLLATVSHELNNPLQAIQNALFLLKEETNISPQGKQDLNIVLAEAERMASMIERLRATYRPTHAEDFQPTQVNNIVEDVYALISTHLRHNQIVFEFHPDPNLPAIPALADQIRQVVLNLLMNASEAMTNGGKINVSTEFIADSNEIMLTVSDTGPGIPQKLIPTVFEAFITNKQSGTGLGLTISYDIVMKHRGRIIAENNPKQGASFKVWLPIQNGEII